jgi:hypothetical protein
MDCPGLTSLFPDSRFSDLAIFPGSSLDTQICTYSWNVHKAVLAARCPAFVKKHSEQFEKKRSEKSETDKIGIKAPVKWLRW